MVAVRDVKYEADGATMSGRLALPDVGGPWPGVLVAHEANGLDEFQRDKPSKLAEAGFAAFALDYHGGGRVYTDRDEMMARIQSLGSDRARIRATAKAGLDVLVAEPGVDSSRVAAIGYCFGSAVVMELARSGADLKAVVGFHPGTADHRVEDNLNIKAKVLMCIGAADPIIPADHRATFQQEMTEAGVDWTIILYGHVKHSFTHPNSASTGIPGLEYNQQAATRSWQAMLDLFAEVL
ncbi:MAG: dienelactone hydrolase family protein [Acidimicrobiaceae bacterium]|nr:dienelactone hydrolase family protein [Acidimicrobiaceae bacterium]